MPGGGETLGALAERDRRIVPIAFHVDYFNDPWKAKYEFIELDGKSPATQGPFVCDRAELEPSEPPARCVRPGQAHRPGPSGERPPLEDDPDRAQPRRSRRPRRKHGDAEIRFAKSCVPSLQQVEYDEPIRSLRHPGCAS